MDSVNDGNTWPSHPFLLQLDLITDLLGTPSMEAMRTACEGARAHILRGPHKQVSVYVCVTYTYITYSSPKNTHASKKKKKIPICVVDVI